MNLRYVTISTRSIVDILNMFGMDIAQPSSFEILFFLLHECAWLELEVRARGSREATVIVAYIAVTRTTSVIYRCSRNDAVGLPGDKRS